MRNLIKLSLYSGFILTIALALNSVYAERGSLSADFERSSSRPEAYEASQNSLKLQKSNLVKEGSAGQNPAASLSTAIGESNQSIGDNGLDLTGYEDVVPMFSNSVNGGPDPVPELLQNLDNINLLEPIIETAGVGGVIELPNENQQITTESDSKNQEAKNVEDKKGK